MGGKTQTTTQNSSTTPAGLAQLNQIWNQVSGVAGQPYTPYTGQMTAGLTPTQQSGISNINNAQGTAQPYFDQAAQYATRGAAPISAGAIQNYENPFTQQVVDATQQQFAHGNAIQQEQVLGNSTARGALGIRTGINQAELARQQQAGQAPAIAGLYAQNYGQALGAAQQDRAAQGQAAYTFGALAPSVQNAQISGANAQLGAGAVEQGTNQAALSASYQQYLQQLAFPYQQAGFLASAGLPAVGAMGGSSAGTTTAPGPSLLSQIAGLGMTGLGVVGGTGGFGSNGWLSNAFGGSGGGTTPTGFTGNTSSPFSGYPGATTSFAGGTPYPVFGRGGRIGYASGGEVNPLASRFDDVFSPFAVPPDNTAANRELATAMADKYLPDGAIELNAGAPVPRPRPFEAPGPATAGSIPEDSGPSPAAMAFNGADPGASTPFTTAPAGLPATASPSVAPPAAQESGPFSGKSGDLWLALTNAGLGTLASKSPFALSAIGEGGLQGTKSLSETTERRRKAEQEATRLAQAASQFAQNLGLHRDQLAETKRRGDTAERRADLAEDRAATPPGYRKAADGSLEAVPGGPADPAVQKVAADAKRGTSGLLADDTISDMAGQYLAGDKSVMQNLGRGAQGAENIVKLRAEISRQARDAGLKPDQVATKMADFAGRTAAMRTLGTRGANVEYAANTANKAIDLAQEAYGKLPRGQFVPFNQLRELYDKKTSSPEQAAAYAATNTLVNEYARVAAGGSNQATEGMRHHAREMLNTAMGPEAFNAVLGMMRREIQTAKSAYNETRREFLQDSHARDEKNGVTAPAAAPGAAPAGSTPAAAPAGRVRQNGHTYERQPDGSYKAID